MKKLRYKYKKTPMPECEEILSRILWHSIPLFYDVSAFEYNSEWNKIVRASNSRHQKKKRVNKYLQGMRDSYYQLWFVSLTFNDETLSETSAETRKKYAQRWLNTYCKDYFANEDFGKENGRHHYHAVVALNDDLQKHVLFDMATRKIMRNNGVKTLDNALRYGWNYGFSNIKPVITHSSEIDEKTENHKISGYLLKLVNHSGKYGTGKSFHKRGLKEVDEIPF